MPPGYCCPNGRPYCPGNARKPPGMQEFPARSAPRRRPLQGSRGSSPGTYRITCGPPEATGSPSPVPAKECLRIDQHDAAGVLVVDVPGRASAAASSRPWGSRGGADSTCVSTPARPITASWRPVRPSPRVAWPSCSLMPWMAGGLIGTGRQARLRGRSCRRAEERNVPGWGRRSSSRSSRGAGGRPVALGEVHLFLSVRRRQASRVPGVTIRCSHRRSGNSSAKAAITGRPAHRGFGQAS